MATESIEVRGQRRNVGFVQPLDARNDGERFGEFLGIVVLLLLVQRLTDVLLKREHVADVRAQRFEVVVADAGRTGIVPDGLLGFRRVVHGRFVPAANQNHNGGRWRAYLPASAAVAASIWSRYARSALATVAMPTFASSQLRCSIASRMYGSVLTP